MAATYKLISSSILASSAASVTFSAIPSTYTDLVLRISARCATDTLDFRFNSDSSSNYSYTQVYGSGSTAYSFRTSNASYGRIGYTSTSGDTADTFGSLELYIPSYTATQNKPISSFTAQETNAASSAIAAFANLWRNTAAINEIFVRTGNGTNILAGSSFYLYGIKNS